MFRLTGDVGQARQYGNSDAEREQESTGSFEPWVELVQEAIKSRQDYVQQSRDLVSQRTTPRGRCPRKQEIPHKGKERLASTAQVYRSRYDLFTLPGGLGHAGEQCVGWIRPGQQVEWPGIDHGCPTYRACNPPSFHPTPQPRATGCRIGPMASATAPAHLHRSHRWDQPGRMRPAPRLGHVSDHVRVKSEHVRKPTFIVRCEFEVEFSQRGGLQRVVSQQAPTADAVEARVTTNPGRQ